MNWQTLFNRRNGAALLIVVGIILAISPAGLRQPARPTPADIAKLIESRSDHIDADALAALLIESPESVTLVDLRDSEAYAQYHIPQALNIQMPELFTPDNLRMLNERDLVVLVSNGGTHAAQAWVLLQQSGVESRVLLGGLNYWAETILAPENPGTAVADDEILRYQFRKSAGQFFQGGVMAKPATDAGEAIVPAPKILFKRKKKKGDEGC